MVVVAAVAAAAAVMQLRDSCNCASVRVCVPPRTHLELRIPKVVCDALDGLLVELVLRPWVDVTLLSETRDVLR